MKKWSRKLQSMYMLQLKIPIEQLLANLVFPTNFRDIAPKEQPKALVGLPIPKIGELARMKKDLTEFKKTRVLLLLQL